MHSSLVRRFSAALFGLALVVLAAAQALAPAQPPAKESAPRQPAPADIAADEKILRDVGEPIDANGLLQYFRKRTFREPDPKKLDQFVSDLGAQSFAAREKAYAGLIALGPSGLPAVRLAETSKDDEVRRRATNIRQEIEQKADPVIQAAVARLIAVRKPAGAAQVLVDYLPFAADESVVEELCRALPAVTVRDGKPEPAVVASLKDKLPIKRGAAGAALVKAGVEGQLPAARLLLKDPDQAVRLRVALALVTDQRDRTAIEPLIATLAHLSPEHLWPAEEILIRLAGEKAPQVSLGSDAVGRERCQQQWAEWWEKHGKEIDLTKANLDQRFLGYTVVVQRTFTRIVKGMRLPPAGLVMELDATRPKPAIRWKFELTTFPSSAEVVGPDRVLLAEFQGQQVSERDFKGNVKWAKAVGGNPLSAHRLPSGNTFVVMQNRLIEYNRKGDEVWRMDRPMFDVFRGRKLRNGEVVFITAQGVLTRIDPRNNNRTLASFNVGPMGSQFGDFEVLPNGNFLVPVYSAQQIIEFDPRGQKRWHAAFQWPTSAQRLPNNNTLVTSQVGRKVAEVDRNGREVWTYQAEGQVYTAQRR